MVAAAAPDAGATKRARRTTDLTRVRRAEASQRKAGCVMRPRQFATIVAEVMKARRGDRAVKISSKVFKPMQQYVEHLAHMILRDTRRSCIDIGGRKRINLANLCFHELRIMDPATFNGGGHINFNPPELWKTGPIVELQSCFSSRSKRAAGGDAADEDDLEEEEEEMPASDNEAEQGEL